MHINKDYFKDFKGVPGIAGQFGQKAKEETKPVAVDLVTQILSWVPKQLTVSHVKALVQDAQRTARALPRPPAAVTGRLRVLVGIVAQARSQGTENAPLTEKATSSIIHAVARVWQALDFIAKQNRQALQIGNTRTILLDAQRRYGAPAPGSAIAPEPQAVEIAVKEAVELADTAKKTGLPGWAWAVIGGGTIGLIALILYLVLGRKKAGMGDAEDDAPLETLPASTKPAT
jgi:hypothetical protein